MRRLGIMLCFLTLGWGMGKAATPEDAELLKVLLKNGAITQAQYDQLAAEAPEQANPPVDIKVSTDGGLQASTYDGKFAFKLGGVFASDLAIYDENKNPLGNGTEIRSARIEMEGTLYSDWDYEFSVDFAQAEVEVKDAFLSYKGLRSLEFQVGQFKAPFSLEEMGSRKHLTFMERALPNEFVPDRRMGAAVRYRSSLWTVAAGIFGEAFGEDVEDEGDEGWATSGRFTFAPIQSDKRLFHIGASAAYMVPNAEKEIRLRTGPESHLTEVTYLNTGRIRDVRHQVSYGIESAIIYGPFSLQWEYMHASLNLEEETDAPSFQGGYVFASWMLTGESRNYKPGRGAFGRIKPDRTYGALELAVRYSVLDLNSRPLVLGGREDNITVACNWHLNRNIRLMTNYVLFNNDLHANDRGDLDEDDDAGVFQARVQVDF